MKFLCLALMVGTVCAAPHALLSAPAISHQYQYLLLQPQYHSSIIKLGPQAIQPISAITKLHTPAHQILYVYPGASSLAPIAPIRFDEKSIPLTLLKQDGGYLEAIYNFFNNLGAPAESPAEMPAEMPAEAPAEAPAAAAPAAPEQPAMKKQMMFEMKKDGDKISLTPASTVKLVEGKKYYILSGQPQFFGNYDAFNNPLHPLISLQSLQPIIARSKEGKDEIQAEAEATPAVKSANPLPVQTFAPLAPVPALVPQQLRFEFDQPQAEPQLVAEPLSNQIVARSLSQEASPLNLEAQPEKEKVIEGLERIIEKSEIIEEARKQEAKMILEAAIINKEASARSSDDLNLAQAKPTAIAIAGDGGVASSGGLATAIAGKDGYAISSPQATSIAGDIFAEDEKAKKE